MHNPIVLWPDSVLDPTAAGNKAAVLSQVKSADLPVPDFFCISTRAYQRLLRTRSVADAIAEAETLGADANLDAVRERADQVRRTICSTPLEPAVAAAVHSALGELPPRFGTIAVRSSSTLEDGAGHSFAGLHRSYLDVDRQSVLDRVRDVLASLWTAESLFLRRRLGIGSAETAMAVIVQAFIPPVTAGVMFSRSPMPGGAETILINAIPGAGEGLVDGSVPADRYALARTDLAVVGRTLADRGGSTAPTLDAGHLTELGKVALGIERLLGAPQDIEWAYVEDRLQLLQSRPITTVADVAEPGAVNAEHEELIAGVRDAVTGRDAEARWWVSNNVGRMPIAPFAQSIWFITGLAQEEASERLALPTLGSWLPVHGYLYTGERPVADERESADERAERSARVCADLATAWEDEYLAEVTANNERLAAVNLDDAASSKLVEHLEDVLEVWHRHWVIHDLAMIPKRKVVDRFVDRCRELLGPDEWRSSVDVLEVASNVNMTISEAIWDLGEFVRKRPTLMRMLTKETTSLAALRTKPSAGEFVAAVGRFLEDWGNRIVGPIDLMHPSWREDPGFLLRSIAQSASSAAEPPSITARDRQHRQEAAETRMLSRIAQHEGLDDGQRREFNSLLRAAQTWTSFLEDHNYLIEQTLAASVRRVALHIGRRLCHAGLVAEPDDVFFLSLDEVKSACRSDQPTAMHVTVASNRREYERRKGVPIPQSLGTWPVSGPADLPARYGEELAYVELDFHPDPTRELPARLFGIPAAAGTARGTARVIDDVNQYAQIKPGDILVCQRTTPSWTPLFSMIAGLVTNSGSGVLQHSAVNAREFGIPAVIGTRVATEVIRTGQLIVVDGARGTVELLG